MVDTDGVITPNEFYEHLAHAENHIDEDGLADLSSLAAGTSVGTEWLEVLRGIENRRFV